MRHVILLLICAVTLSACSEEPKKLTTPAQWQKYGYHDHLMQNNK
ncbi:MULTISPECIES: hypothetical protein [Acetobacter]|uniref:Lipoprotein n=1 Tax=Acetobacter thailandicus TaxID=1502842 RepID=A0ABT3QGB7_9PROT|nr:MULTISPECIES: hypothetical protein [Acetobacter]MCX2564328.1 hypothetical protein [Acetobacter thailandicus]